MLAGVRKFNLIQKAVTPPDNANNAAAVISAVSQHLAEHCRAIFLAAFVGVSFMTLVG